MTVEIHEDGDGPADVEPLARFAAEVLKRENVGSEAELVITFVDTQRMAELNSSHMGKTGPTDVLSFPIEDAAPHQPPEAIAGGPPLVLGDIFISTKVVAQHADDFGVSVSDELHLMVCHGVLHILGWDHQTDRDAEAMEAREAEHLATIGRARR